MIVVFFLGLFNLTVHRGFSVLLFVPCRMSTKPDIVSVDPLYLEKEPGCSREAVLTAQSPQPIRLSSIIIAKELGNYCIHIIM